MSVAEGNRDSHWLHPEDDEAVPAGGKRSQKYEREERFRANLTSLFELHRCDLHRLAWAILRCHADAEDVLHSVYLRLLRRGPVPPPIQAGYLARAVINGARDLCRRRRARRQALGAWDQMSPPPRNESDNAPGQLAFLKISCPNSLPGNAGCLCGSTWRGHPRRRWPGSWVSPSRV